MRFTDQPNEPYLYDHATGLVISHDVRPGKVTLRDFDFRRSPTYKLFGASDAPKNIEERLEQYHYAPSSFMVEKAVASHLPGGIPAIPLGGPLGSLANTTAADIVSLIPGAASVKSVATGWPPRSRANCRQRPGSRRGQRVGDTAPRTRSRPR